MNLFPQNDAVVLIDGRNLVFRNHWVHHDLKTSTGEPTGVLFGCLNGLLSLNRRLPGVPLVFVWDGGGETWRHRLMNPQADQRPMSSQFIQTARVVPQKPRSWMEGQIQKSVQNLVKTLPVVEKPEPTVPKLMGYKANRELTVDKKEERRIAKSQIKELMNVLDMLGIRNFEVTGLEGDDLIGILSTAIHDRRIFNQVIIHSTDKDFYQLMMTSGVRLLRGLDPMGELDWVDQQKVEKKYKIRLDEWVAYRAITGDESDNIDGWIPGIGPIKAVKLLRMGLDPSQKKYENLPYLVRKGLDEVTVPKVGRLDAGMRWGKLRRNYLCSKIVTDGDLSMLDEELQGKVNRLVGVLSPKSFYRINRGEEGSRSFLEWLIRREMKELYSRRDDFRELV